jgi:Flp pilus assembly protein TadG
MKHGMMSVRRYMLRSALLRRASQFTQDKRGVSAVEFALLLPVMLTLYLGGVEVSQGVTIDRKVTLSARTVADLVSQVASVTTSDVSAAIGASTAILAPYPDAPAKVSVSVVAIDSNGNAKVSWSQAKNTTARPTGSAVDVPAALKVPNTSLVLGEVSYSYTPSIGYVVTGTMNLSDRIFVRPRLSETVTRS